MRTYHTVKSGRKGVTRLDLIPRRQYATEVVRLKGFDNEEDVSAERTTPEEDARLPRAYEDSGWAQGPQAAAGQGAQAAHRLGRTLSRAERLRSAGEFQAVFERGKRLERPAFVVLWSSTPRKRKAGFTVSRQIRGAVSRNRARRRLREAYRGRTVANPDDISMVFVARPPALTSAFAKLVEAMDEVMRRLGGGQGIRNA